MDTQVITVKFQFDEFLYTFICRRKLMKMQMDEAIEHLQINLAVDFGMDDDIAIERLRENMHDMRSHRLDHPGRAPSEELPEKPFGLVDFADDADHEHDDPDMILPDESKPKEWTVAKEAGLRIGFTEKEREFSQNAILRASHMMENADLDEMDDEEEDFDDTGLANSFDDSSQMRALRSTSTAAGQDFDTSFDASDIIPNNGGGGHEVFDDDDDVVHVLQGGKSPLPPSQEQDRLDNSLR